MRARRLSFHCGIALCLATGSLLGCDEGPSGVVVPPATYSYPLAIGNVWHHERTRLIRYLTPDGTSEVRPPQQLHAESYRTIVGEEFIAGIPFRIEREDFFFEDTDTVHSWRRLRQDASGLYRADLSLSFPPGSVPPLDSIAEITLFRYPPTPGERWAIRPGSTSMRTLEGVDTLALDYGDFPAWRIRIDLFNQNPEDVHYEWYGRDGLLLRLDHTELLAVDGGSGDIIRIVSDETLRLLAPPVPASLAAETGNTPHQPPDRNSAWSESEGARLESQ